MSEKIGEGASNEPQGANNNPWESLSEKKSPMTFQVAPGTTKEAEFKRLTGEDWPGEKYYAETSGVDDDGYDYPIETWTIRERIPEDNSETDGLTEELQQYWQKLQENPRPDFYGETNINRATGKKRTFTEWDNYPIKNGEEEDKILEKNFGVKTDGATTQEKYGQRLRLMHQKTAEYLEQEKDKKTEQAAATEEEKKPAEESYYERMMRKVNDHKNLTEAHKENLRKLLDRKFKGQEGYVPGEVQVTEADRAYRAWLQRNAAEGQQKELESARKKELELARQKELEKYRSKTKAERLERLKSLKEEDAKDRARLAEIDKKLSEPDGEGQPDEEEHKPLIAVNADFTHDKKDLAHDLAERNLNDEVASAKGFKGFVKRLWKGTLFKKYYEQRYTREFMEGDRAVKIDGTEYNLDKLMERRKDGAIARFVMSVVEDSEQFIHKKAGEEMTEASAEVTTEIRAAIEKFATAQNVPPEQRKREFRNELDRIKAEHRDNGEQVGQAIFDNYEYVAEQAFERVSHGIAIEKVMEGFKVYNAKARDGARTEAHRDAIDKIVNKVESSALGRFIPAEAMAAACSVASTLTQFGTGFVVGAVGGVLASSAFSGLKERNRITEDRARRLRDAAEGMSYEEGDRQVKKRVAKYEARIGGTLYDLRPANELATNIENAMQTEGEERDDAVLRAIAEARVRIDFSDSESKDLISYTSAEKRGDERLRLDVATIRAEKSLSDSEKARLEILKKQVTEEINEQVDEADSKFRRMRASMAVKKAGKTLVIGAAISITVSTVIQETIAAISPNKIGVLEKAGIIKNENAEGAKETILASLIRRNPNPSRVTVMEPHTETIENVSGDRTVEIEAYEKAGYEKVETSPAWTETRRGLTEVKPSESSAAIQIKHDGWANNGTKVADGNELRIRINNGSMVSGMHGNSTMGNQVFNYETLAQAGRIKGYLTEGGATMELVPRVDASGRLVWGENGLFTTTTGETIRGIGENGEKLYRFFEVAVDNGVDADGVHHIIPLATDRGRDTFTGTIQQISEQVIEHPATYSFVKTTVSEIPRGVAETAGTTTAAEVFTSGIVFAPETARTGLGGPAGSIVEGRRPEEENQAAA